METLLNRAKLNARTGCWEWTGAHDSNGYGMISRNGRRVRLHRLVAQLVLGLASDDTRIVLHKCDNPGCFNPDHLTIGTQGDNMVDCSDKGRIANSKKTHCKRGHPLTGTNLYVCTNASGRPMRVCRACRKDRIRLYMRKKRHAAISPHASSR